MDKNEAPRSKLRGIKAEFLRSQQPHFAKASLGVLLAPSSSEQALRFSAKGNKIILGSLSMDLKRVALGYYRNSTKMAEVFMGEAMKRKEEVDLATVKPYIRDLLIRLKSMKNEKDKQKVAEDALMYSTLFQNAALYGH